MRARVRALAAAFRPRAPREVNAPARLERLDVHEQRQARRIDGRTRVAKGRALALRARHGADGFDRHALELVERLLAQDGNLVQGRWGQVRARGASVRR